VAIEAQVLAALDRFGLDRSWLVRRDFQLSPADRLWVALVRASLWEPAVLLLDDVWSRLSEDQGDRLQRILEAGWGAEGAAPTVVLVGPTTEPLTRWVTRVWVLDGGQLTRDCSVEDWDWSAWGEPVDPAATPNEGTDPDADWF
jgi:energy-coupling factor transporter ATP-binding protein EcfA2